MLIGPWVAMGWLGKSTVSSHFPRQILLELAAWPQALGPPWFEGGISPETLPFPPSLPPHINM